MAIHAVEHTIFEQKKWAKRVLLKLRKKSFRKKLFQSDFFFQQILKESPIPNVNLNELVSKSKLQMENFLSRNGNVSPYELMAICLLAKDCKQILEIGTFDGNTTLQLALNTSDEARIHTIDLPQGEMSTAQPVLGSDLQFIRDEKKEKRKFEGTDGGKKVIQHFGDSTAYDFDKFCEEGSLDFVFIDGGHSYECVKSDTQNVLPRLSVGGTILWHDFTPLFGGVFQFLHELSSQLNLHHIEGTNLVLYRKEET